MLQVLHSLYNFSPKCYPKLKRLVEAWQISIPKPTKTSGTCWIEHKVNAMKIALENYGAFLSHIESLLHFHSIAAKREELKGYLKKWKDYSAYLPRYPFSHTLFKLRFLTGVAWPDQSCLKLHALINTTLGETAGWIWTHWKQQNKLSRGYSG